MKEILYDINIGLRLIGKVADIIERLSEYNQDLLLFRYKYNCDDALIADLMVIPKEEVELAVNHAKILAAMSLRLKQVDRYMRLF